MAANRPRVYLCSCCFIDLVKQEAGIPLDADRDNEVWFIDQILKANLDGEI
jgi:hypothetical protein